MTLVRRISDWFFDRRHHLAEWPYNESARCSCGDWYPCEARNVRRRRSAS